MIDKRRVSFHTLGCKLNYSETSTIARQFEQGGFVRVQESEKADICVINTCSVTMNADKKGRNLIRQLIRKNPDAIIAVTGCYAQLKPEEIGMIEGVDLVIGNNDKGELYQHVVELASKREGGAKIYSCEVEELTRFFASFSSGDRTRAFLKVQDGCSYKCTYCTIPYARGESRNMPIEQIVANAKLIAATGQKEIVITGINTGDFGRTTGESFIDLLKALDKIEGIERYRISSIEPNLLTDEVIELTKNSAKFQPHFHIPLQSGSNRILKSMQRRYTTEVFMDRIKSVRRAIPDAFIGIDLIVGFPGESEEDFETTYNLLENLAPSYLHIFPYSERAGTPAVELEGKVSPKIISQRVASFTELSNRLNREFTERFVGGQALVLFESTKTREMMNGFTENYIRVVMPYDETKVNKIVRVKLGAILDGGEINATVLE